MKSVPTYPKAAVLILTTLAFALLGWAALHWSFFLGPLPPGAGVSPFLPAAILLVMQPSWVHPVSWLCIAAAIAGTGLLSLVLLRAGKENHPAVNLATASGACAALLAYWTLVIPLRPWPSSALIAADIASGFLLALLLQRLMAFSCGFPRPVDLEALLQWGRAKREVRDGKLPIWLNRYHRIGASTLEQIFDWRVQNVRRFVSFQLSGRGLVVFGMLFALSALLIRHSVESTAHKKVVFALGVFGLIYPATFFLAWITQPLQWTLSTGTEAERRKIYWIYWGAALAFWGPTVAFWTSMAAAIFASDNFYYLTVASLSAGFPAAIFFITVALAFAIFFQGALDPRLAISRTSVIGLFGMALPPLILAGERFIQHGLLAQFDLPRHATTWVLVGLTAVTFRPVGRRLEGWLAAKLDEWLPASALAGAERASAVIGFVDLSGYTALSAQDEKAALTHAAALHKAGRTAMASGGRLVKTLGDAVLWESSSAAKAVAVARALQAAYTAECAAEKLIPLPLHFGLHAGEIVRSKDGDVFGSTVNIASRLLGQAGSGEIVASAAVVEGLAGTSFSVQPLGAKALKNVPEPVFCFRIASA